MNPYAPPEAPMDRELDPNAAARKRVSRPATALIIMSSIHSVFVSIFLVNDLVNALGRSDLFFEFFELGLPGLQLVCLIFISIGAAKLGFLESYRLARIGSFLACIPIVTPFVFLGIPFGIWALLLLSDPKIRAAFPPPQGAGAFGESPSTILKN